MSRFTRYLDYYFKCKNSQARRRDSRVEITGDEDMGNEDERKYKRHSLSESGEIKRDDSFDVFAQSSGENIGFTPPSPFRRHRSRSGSPSPLMDHNVLRIPRDSLSDLDEHTEGSLGYPESPLKFSDPSPLLLRQYSSGSPNLFPTSLENLLHEFYTGDDGTSDKVCIVLEHGS